MKVFTFIERFFTSGHSHHLGKIAAGRITQNADFSRVDAENLRIGFEIAHSRFAVFQNGGEFIRDDSVFGSGHNKTGFSQCKAHFNEFFVICAREAASREINYRRLFLRSSRNEKRHTHRTIGSSGMDLGVDDVADFVNLVFCDFNTHCFRLGG